jgi:hypothetical protein
MSNELQVDDDVLMAYLSGSLEIESMHAVGRAINHDSALQKRYAFLSHLQDSLAKDYLETADTRPRSVNDQTTTDSSARVPPPQSKQHQKPLADSPHYRSTLHGKKSWLQNKSRWLYGAVGAQALLIALLLPVAWQGLPLGQTDPDTVGYRGAESTERIVFIVSFKPLSTEAQIRGLLLDAQASIAGGPDSLGDYKITVAKNHSQLAMEKFKSSPLIEQVKKHD